LKLAFPAIKEEYHSTRQCDFLSQKRLKLKRVRTAVMAFNLAAQTSGQ
jgi:hypothetical protein